MSNNEYYQPQVTPVPQDIEKKGMAIASLVVSIIGAVSCCCGPLAIFLGILSVIFSVVVFNANKDNGKTKGKGMAIAGLIIGILAILLGVFGIIPWFIPDFREGFMEGFNEGYNGY